MPDRGILQAEQRVREMNRLTRHYAEQGNRYIQSISAPPPRFEPMRPAEPAAAGHVSSPVSPPPHQQQRQNTGSRSASTINFLGIENDKLLLIALLYLLIKENADIKLILALGYLLL